MLISLGITFSETAAQKPAIDLLPSTHEIIHPEAVVDTSCTYDSQARRIQTGRKASEPGRESGEERTLQDENREKGRSLDLPVQGVNPKKVRHGHKPRRNPLIFRNSNPIRFLILVNALKYDL
jgi:hypothetical protein